jgi:hypothetical protein
MGEVVVSLSGVFSSEIFSPGVFLSGVFLSADISTMLLCDDVGVWGISLIVSIILEGLGLEGVFNLSTDVCIDNLIRNFNVGTTFTITRELIYYYDNYTIIIIQ